MASLRLLSPHRLSAARRCVIALIVPRTDLLFANQTYLRLESGRITELQLENSWLRLLVTDLLLGKVKLEETARSKRIRRVKGRDEHPGNDRV
jgi:hypothetical protein